jgi:gamma-glutamyltranspeptidase
MVNKAIVSSSHELASFWGANALLKGGNVVDAAIATSAVLSVVQNNLCGLGGDLFALVKLNGRISELNGSGRAAGAATIDFYKQKGFFEIPQRGPLAALTVPGIVHAWGELAKLATMELSELLQPAITYAEKGFPLTEKYANSIRASSSALGGFKEWAKIFMPSEVPSAGYLLKQKDLANTLKAIAQSGPADFYNGGLSEKIAKGISESGGIIASGDLKNHDSTWVEKPLSTDYRGVRIYETSPNSQGVTLLLWLNMLESYDLAKMGFASEKFTEILVETCVKAYAERAKLIGDPLFSPLPSEFTSKKFAQDVLNSEKLDSVITPTSTHQQGDTTYFALADAEGNSMSVIQSNYMGFGSGLVPRGTGIVLQNRGCYFSLDRFHHNALAPGKRTFHTLCASMAERDGETLFAMGSMGGDIQPQIHVQLITQMIDFGTDLQRAIDNPRWTIPITIYEKPTRVYFESTPMKKSFGKLEAASLGGLSSSAGHAQAVYRTPAGLFGAADPRGDGASVGF